MDCYAEGMGLNSLCRVFKVGINSIQSWIKAEGEKFIQPDTSKEKFVSCDEMWTFVQKKKQKAWIWLCFSKMTKKILAVHIGNRGKYSAKKLIDHCVYFHILFLCTVSKHTIRRRAGWSPIRAPAGAQPYEWYVTFKKNIFMYRGPRNHSAPRRPEPRLKLSGLRPAEPKLKKLRLGVPRTSPAGRAR